MLGSRPLNATNDSMAGREPPFDKISCQNFWPASLLNSPSFMNLATKLFQWRAFDLLGHQQDLRWQAN
jgi:hypothetical protein